MKSNKKHAATNNATAAAKGKARWARAVLPLVLVVAFAAVTLAVVWPRLPQKDTPEQAPNYKGILELWNVECFEGGSGSRASWLTARAAKFEQKNAGLFVHVTTLTEAQLQQKLDAGEAFDMICFPRGVGCAVQQLLQPYTGSVADIRDNILISGEVSNTVLALPVYCGVYCLFARENQLPKNADLLATALTNTYAKKVGKNTVNLQPLICGFTPYNSPFSALAMSGARGKAQPDAQISQYAAYQAFVDNNTAVTLLGTQRDLFRLSKREQEGKIDPLLFVALGGFTDLVQYLGVAAGTDAQKAQSCQQFLQYLVSAEAQQTLTQINMFSVLQQGFYTQKRYLDCEKCLQTAYVPNAFGDAESISSQRQTALATLGM